MSKINYVGLKKRDTYDEIVNYIETDPNKIRYPNRDATLIEQSHYMKMLGGQDYVDMEQQQNNAIKESMKDGLIRRVAGNTGGTRSLYKAAAETAVPEPQVFDISSDKDQEMEDHAKGVTAVVQEDKNKKIGKAAANVGMADVAKEGFQQAAIPSLIATRELRRAKRTTTADDEAMPSTGGVASSSTDLPAAATGGASSSKKLPTHVKGGASSSKDSHASASTDLPETKGPAVSLAPLGEDGSGVVKTKAVSYTHLTLPTIYSV